VGALHRNATLILEGAHALAAIASRPLDMALPSGFPLSRGVLPAIQDVREVTASAFLGVHSGAGAGAGGSTLSRQEELLKDFVRDFRTEHRANQARSTGVFQAPISFFRGVVGSDFIKILEALPDANAQYLAIREHAQREPFSRTAEVVSTLLRNDKYFSLAGDFHSLSTGAGSTLP
jgi:hypothetical protein